MLIGLVLVVFVWPYAAAAGAHRELKTFCQSIPSQASLAQITRMASSEPEKGLQVYEYSPGNLRVKSKGCTCIVLLQPSGTKLGDSWCNH